ncbi:glycosyltransferase family protein [Hydrogenimonas sp.]
MKIGLLYEDIPNRNPSEKIFTDIFFENFETEVFDAARMNDAAYMERFFSDNDLIVTHFYAFLHGDEEAPKKIDITYFPRNYQTIIRHHETLLEAVSKHGKPLVVMFVRSDWYSHSENFWRSIPSDATLFGGFKKGYLNTDASNEFIFEKFGHAIDLGNRYIADERIIPLHHVVDRQELEFCESFERKSYDISVLGVLYSRRERIHTTLKRNPSIHYYDQKLLLRLRKMLNRFDKKKYRFNHLLLSYLFKRAICRSRMSYTDGSELDMFVRKYLEIPALKSMLYCDPFKGMEEYGFIEDRDYVRVDHDHLAEQIEHLLLDEEKRIAIARNGHDLVRSLFSKEALASPIREIFGHIAERRLRNVYWKAGKLHIESR